MPAHSAHELQGQRLSGVWCTASRWSFKCSWVHSSYASGIAPRKPLVYSAASTSHQAAVEIAAHFAPHRCPTGTRMLPQHWPASQPHFLARCPQSHRSGCAGRPCCCPCVLQAGMDARSESATLHDSIWQLQMQPMGHASTTCRQPKKPATQRRGWTSSS